MIEVNHTLFKTGKIPHQLYLYIILRGDNCDFKTR